MKLAREWITPLTIGTFVVMGATGLLMFFHVDQGLNKVLHEWLGWALVAAVVLHVVVNFNAFKRYFAQTPGRALMGLCTLVLVGSFFVGGEGQGDGPPFATPVRALAQAPLATLAQVARVSPEQLRERLIQQGLQPTSDTQSLQDLTGPDLRRQVHVLGDVMRQP